MCPGFWVHITISVVFNLFYTSTYALLTPIVKNKKARGSLSPSMFAVELAIGIEPTTC